MLRNLHEAVAFLIVMMANIKTRNKDIYIMYCVMSFYKANNVYMAYRVCGLAT
jgi:hypothetical protein